MRRKRFSLLVHVVCLILLLAIALPAMMGCGSGLTKVGITQIVTHPALDANRQGFIDQMKMGNPSVTYQVTDSGLKLLQLINNIREMLGMNEDDGL